MEILHAFSGLQRWKRRLSLTTLGVMVCALAVVLVTPVAAAPTFADAAFQSQWQAGEGVVANFWGPRLTPMSVRHEAYQESPGGTRLVQYFDKGRMELNKPTATTATSGLLTVELLRGQVQTGENTYENRGPANIPLAGDPTNIGPTFAMLQQKQAALLTPGPSKIGAATTRTMTATGSSGAYPDGADYPKAAIGAYDSTTGHNVAAAFVTFRAQVGVLMTGLAVSEPFWSTVTVGGAPKDVLIQAFERRVLTYTPDNPAAYRVEFGNIGQQYYAWRYNDGDSDEAATATKPTTTATATPPANATAAAPCATPARASFNTMPANITRNTPMVATATVVDSNGKVCGDGTQVVIADNGTATTFDGGVKAANGTAYVVVTVKNGVARAIYTFKGQSQESNPVRLGIYAVGSAANLKNGVYGAALVDPLYIPMIL